MPNIELIYTERLSLVEIDESMVGTISLWMQDRYVMKYMPMGVHKSEEDTVKWIDECISSNQKGSDLTWIILDNTMFTVGWISAKYVHHNTYVVSYLQRPSCWGNGYIKEALNGVIEYLFTKCGVNTVMCTCHPKNIRSERVMQSVGMHRVWMDKTCVDKESGKLEYQRCYVINRLK